MPIIERDPWRMQYFEDIPCPDHIIIPTDDEHAYELYPRHRWLYNKLLICETQGLAAAPHGVPPPQFPVFSKPIYNMHGIGVGGQVVDNAEELQQAMSAGYMWMPLLTGEHVSSDVVVVDGEPCWWRHTLGKALGDGVFDYWTILAEPRPELEAYCGEWLQRNLKGYSGAINMETIDGKIIEAHLRFADQWPDIYGAGWLHAIVGLYVDGRWHYCDDRRRTGYSVVLFGAHGIHYPAIDQQFIDELLLRPSVSSIQVTFHPDLAPELHAMPPGGFRLAVINCWNLAAGCKVREELALRFWSAQTLVKQ
jgi:hypothetical protein